MRKLFTLIAAAAILIAAAGPTFGQTVYTMTGNGDTVSTLTTKYLTLPVVSPGAMTVQFAFDRIADTVQGSAFLEGSVDNVDFARVPEADTVIVNTISATTARHLWFLDNNKLRYYRIGLKTTKASGSGKVRGKVYR